MQLPKGCLVNVAALGHLGIGKLYGFDDLGQASIKFAGEQLIKMARNTPIVRVRLAVSTPVRFMTPEGAIAQGKIAEFLAERPDGGCVYLVATDDDVHEVWEGAIVPIAEENNPLQMLKAYRWNSPKNFFARWSIADIHNRWCAASGGIPSMLGARVVPLAHQIYAARRVLFERVPRFILADEVGLGKTIEAGLIVQALQAERSDLRVLVIAPGSMSRQWLAEAYLRFGARVYHHIDSARVRKEKPSSLRALIASGCVIVATTALDAHAEVASMVAAQPWDMVIIDEAHQIPSGSSLYRLLQEITAKTEGLLLLSATPSKRDIGGLLAMLALVAPDAFADETPSGLREKYDRQSAVWDRLNFTRKIIDAVAAEGRDLDAGELGYIADDWDKLIEGDSHVEQLLARMRSGDATAAIELVAYVQEFHRLDHRIIRTRRASIFNEGHGWPPRTLIELACERTREESIFLNLLEELPHSQTNDAIAVRSLYLRYCSTSPASALHFLKARAASIEAHEGIDAAIDDPIATLSMDSGPNDEAFILADLTRRLPPMEGEADWLKIAIPLAEAWREDGGFSRAEVLAEWLQDHLVEPANQVLVFAQDARVVEDLVSGLAARFGAKAVARFHCEMDEADLAETAFRFQNDPTCRVLVSDELGGEGRNFQNASAVVHFDLPVSCARLEQRIGRLDRVGRSIDRPVLSVVLDPPHPTDKALLAIHRDVLGVFSGSIGGLEFILPALQRKVQAAYGDSPDSLRTLSSELRAEVEAALGATDEAFDISLDATKPQLERSSAIATSISEQNDADKNASILRYWASCLGIQASTREGGVAEFKWTNGSLNVRNDGLKIGSGKDEERRQLSGTFHRKTALARENLQFFAPGHVLVDTMVQEAERGLQSRVTAYALSGFGSLKGTLLLQVLGRCVLDDALWADHDIGPGLAARARSIFWPEIVPEIMLLRDRTGPRQNILTHAGLRSVLDAPPKDMGWQAIEPAAINAWPILPDLWKSIDASIPIAVQSIATRRAAHAQERASALEESLRGEMGYLRWRLRHASGEDEAGAHQAAIEARRALIASIRAPRTELFGLALVVLL